MKRFAFSSRVAAACCVAGALVAFVLASCATAPAPAPVPFPLGDRFVAATAIADDEWEQMAPTIYYRYGKRFFQYDPTRTFTLRTPYEPGYADDDRRDFRVAKIDLDGDGVDEALARGPCPFPCGVLVFGRRDGRWTRVGEVTGEELVAIPERRGFALRDQYLDARMINGALAYFRADGTQQPALDFVRGAALSAAQWTTVLDAWGYPPEERPLISRDDFRVAFLDLDGDGRPEVFADYIALGQCNGGCLVRVFRQNNGSWSRIQSAPDDGLDVVPDRTQSFSTLRWNGGKARWTGSRYFMPCYWECG